MIFDAWTLSYNFNKTNRADRRFLTPLYAWKLAKYIKCAQFLNSPKAINLPNFENLPKRNQKEYLWPTLKLTKDSLEIHQRQYIWYICPIFKHRVFKYVQLGWYQVKITFFSSYRLLKKLGHIVAPPLLHIPNASIAFVKNQCPSNTRIKQEFHHLLLYRTANVIVSVFKCVFLNIFQ